MAFNDPTNTGFANLALLESLYVKYQTDPWSLDEKWRLYFSGFEESLKTNEVEKKRQTGQSGIAPSIEDGGFSQSGEISSNLRIYHLIQSYRTYGHLKAKTNPISLGAVMAPRQLKLEALGFKESELDELFPADGLIPKRRAPLKEIIGTLEEIYCGDIGVEYVGVLNPDMERWLQEHIEPGRFQVDISFDQKKMILQHLNKSELFESFLHTKYVGQKRFSLEGGETLIPILASVIEKGGDLGLEDFVIGMAHRGRLNVLANILNKSYSLIFTEFQEGYIPDSFEGSGDVKYHKGFSSTLTTGHGHRVKISLAPNPSHLEAVYPVVQGQVRARQVKNGDGNGRFKSLPVIIHGDAAISGQGIVYETMQMYQLEGYATGGTVHIVINNQIGFTTLPRDSRSTHYCTDIARTFNAPVFHVNAEDPEGCVFATNLAMEIRQKFHCDVFIDLICYRKYGHNESDEPAFTQPLEYQIIRKKKPIREIYRDYLIGQGVLEKEMAEALEEEFKQSLQKALSGTEDPVKKGENDPAKKDISENKTLNSGTETFLSLDALKDIGERISRIPEGLTIHPKLQKVIMERREMAEGKRPADWGMGETLAYASLLLEGKHVRISGQDCCRGTFSHRHALWMDQVQERAYYPLKNLKQGQGRFDVFNSLLSEYSVLGFEYGYSIAYPEALVIWEAQFGDFCNGAQVIIDQFISTGEMKWMQKTGVVLLLPHGYEGQGPEHSSARMERFLALCGNQNMRVVNPTEPAQLFHLLRRQVLLPMLKPLIVFTPKGLLRHPECVNQAEDFTKGGFQDILDDPKTPTECETLVFCSGKIYYDLTAERAKRDIKSMAIVRIEELYPLNEEKISSLIEKYRGFSRSLWVQEEPQNMGAWDFIGPKLEELLPKDASLGYIGRRRSASPAVGSFALHKKEHAEIMDALFGKE